MKITEEEIEATQKALVAAIGGPATLEQFAEECAEACQAALKFARYVRGENPAHKSESEIVDNFHEEIADVMVCIETLKNCGIVNADAVVTERKRKMIRMRSRLDQLKESN